MRESQTISITTEDDVKLAAHYYKGTGNKGVIFLHQLASSKESWKSLIQEVPEEYHLVSIDLRGHGASDLKWEELDDEGFNAMTKDADAGFHYLQEQGVEQMSIAGSSIGANIALKFGLNHNVTGTVLISPGLTYRGIDISQDMEHVTKPTLIIVGTEDGYAYQSSKEINEKIPIDDKEVLKKSSNKHGTSLLDETTIPHVIEWLEKHT